MLYSPIGAQLLGFAPLQPFGVYSWQAYVQPGDGHWSTPGMHRVAVPSTTLGRGEPSATHSAVLQPFGGAYSLGSSVESHLIPPSEACLYGHINWSLEQAHSVGFLSLFLLRRLARPDHGLGSNSQCRRDLCQGLCWGLVGHLCLNGLT